MPRREHAKLHNPPLKKMLIQLRYPAEFGFDSTLIRPLQKVLAPRFPVASGEQFIAGVMVGVTVNQEIKAPPVEFKQLFRFATLDGEGVVQVTEDFIAYETTGYNRFADFIEVWRETIELVVEKLELGTQLRLGLRYSNIIENPSITTVEEWQGLIADHLLMPVIESGKELDATCFTARQELRYNTPYGTCTLNHGFTASEADGPSGSGYVLDIDSYDEIPKPINIEQQLGTLAKWNDQTYRLLRKSVSDDLWKSFNPDDVEGKR